MRQVREISKLNVFLYFSVLTANLATFQLGGTSGWSSPVIPKLNGQIDAQNNPLQANITKSEESWIASLLPLGAAISNCGSGYLADRIGRKNTLLLSSLPMILGFVINAFATDVIYFYVGRFLNGLGAGPIFTVMPLYVGEIAENSNRGLLGGFFAVFMCLGNIFSYSVGPYVSITALSLLNALPSAVFLIVFGLLVPESPYFLISSNRLEKAENSLMKLRNGKVDAVKKELREISKNIEESFAKRRGIKDLFCEKGSRKAICLTVGLVTFQQMSGVNLIFFYMQSIFEQTDSNTPSEISVIIVSIVQFLASVLASSLVDRVGRKVLLLLSATGTSLSLFAFALFFHLKDHQENVESIYWLPTVSIICFVLSYMVGFGSLPYTIIGEIFPPHVKSAASSITILWCLFLTFCVTTFFPHLLEVVGMPSLFWLLSCVCAVGGVFVYLCIPETKGKSLREIQDMLVG